MHCVVPAGNSTVRDTHERCHMSATTTIAEVNQVYATGRTRSIGWRLSQLAALQQLLEDNTETLESALQQDLGKNGFEAWLSEIGQVLAEIDRKSTRLNSSHVAISYAVFCLKKK